MRKLQIVLLLFLVGFSLTASFVYSQSPLPISVNNESVNPGDDYKYVIKRFKEKFMLFVYSISVQKKISYYNKLIDVRLSEMKYVGDKKDIANFQTTSQRYSAVSGETTDFVLSKGKSEDKKKLIEKFQSHIPVLVRLQTPYIPDNSEWRFLEDNINSLKSYISRLSE